VFLFFVTLSLSLSSLADRSEIYLPFSALALVSINDDFEKNKFSVLLHIRYYYKKKI
jgi:hypothetical protein